MTDQWPKGRPPITPAEFADFLPEPLVLSTTAEMWSVTVQRLRYQPARLDYPPARDHRLALHLAGPTLIEETRSRRDSRWSDSGQASLIPAGEPAKREFKGRPDFLLVHVPPELLNDVLLEAYDIDPASVDMVNHLAVPDPALDRLGRMLLAEAEANAPGGRLVADSLARTLAVHLLRRYSSVSLPNDVAVDAMPAPRLRRVLDYMQANLEHDLSLAQLAAVGGLSPTQFTRAFRLATGESPYRYLIGLRIAKARKELETTNLAVIEIGLRCGFEQPSHFATTFRKATGMTPREYRAIRRG